MSQYAPKKPGVFNSFNITLAVIVLVGGYFGWWYLPHWFKVWRLTGSMVTIGRDGYREFDDEKLIKNLVSEARRLEIPATAENFLIKREPYTLDELSKFKDTFYPSSRGKAITVAFATVMDAEWPLVGGSVPLEFERQKTVDLSMTHPP